MHLSASPRRLGARARARLERSRLRRGLGPGDAPAHAAARLDAFASLAPSTGAGAGAVWRPLGPFAVPHGQTHGSGPGSRPAVAGRVTAVAVDPSDGAHLLLGTGGGGIWESRDGGVSWRPRTDELPAPAIGAVAFDPRDPAVAYAGSGEGSFSAELAVGLLRSDDGGASWRLLEAGELTGAGFHDLAVLPDGRLLAATTAGLYESGDRGASWTRRLAGQVWDLSPAGGSGRRGPGNPEGVPRSVELQRAPPALGEVLAGCAAGVCSSDDGTAWTPVPLPAAPSGFERVAVCHAAGGAAYVFAAGDGVGHLWRRDRAGGPFEPVKPPADLQSQQAWYAWVVAAPPDEAEVLLLGAVGLHRGVRGADGRWSWVDLAARPAGDDLPPDQHAVAVAPGDPAVLYVGNDGGLFRSPDGGRSWRALNAGLAIAEVGHLAGHPEHDAWLLAGAGGLGTLRYEGGEVWFHVDDGDGGAGAVDQTRPGTCWHGFSGPGLARSERGGGWGTWQAVEPGSPGGGLDPPLAAGDGLVVHGGGPLAVSADGGASWTEVPLPQSGRASALAVGGPDRIWVGTEAGEVLRLEGAGWRVAARARPRPGYLSGLAADPARPEVLWATWSDRRGGVWRSDDAGTSWTDRGGGLPAVPLNAVAVDPDRPDTVLVAADLGVWRSDDAGASWRPFGRGLPATPVAALEVHRPTRLLRAALLGRGVWEAPLGDPGRAAGAAGGGRGAGAAGAAGGGRTAGAAGGSPSSAEPAPRLHLRGTRADGGRGGAFPAGRPDPFGGGEATWWWQSPDVKVEAPPDPAWDPAGVGPGVFEDDHGVGATGLPDAGGRVLPGAPARVWVQVHNRGAATATGIRVRVLAAPAFLGWPGRLAADPDRDPPPGSPWRAVAPPATLEAVEPGRAGVVAVDWAVPDGMVADLSLLALAAAGGDPARFTGARPIGGPPWGPPNPSGPPGEPDPLDRHLGLLGVTVLHPATGPRVLRLEVWATGDPPFALAAEPGAQELVAGLLPGPALAGAARAAGLEPARPPDAWRPELVAAVQQDPGLAERLDLTSAFPAPSAGRGGSGDPRGVPRLDRTWLGGIGLDAERPEAMLLLLREPVRPGGGSLLLLDAAGRVVGGHTLRVPPGPAPA